IDSQIWVKDIKNHEDGGETEKLLRGGSWNYLARDCRSAYRNNNLARVRIIDIGFRVVCSLR
ncbi:MAG: hypothetical protein ACKPEO_17015, partial [Sphaerospermopsis kisseleviana]